MTSNFNQLTKATYEQGVQRYIDSTPTQVVGNDYQPFLDTFASLVGDGAVLEVGSAVGRDAAYLEERGVNIRRSDYAESFVHYLEQQGYTALRFDVINDQLDQKFVGIIANAVFLHFTLEECEQALENVQRHLLPNGYFAISVKAGKGEEVTRAKMDSPRYFKYWQPDELEAVLKAHDFTVLHTFRPDNGKWIQFITQSTRE